MFEDLPKTKAECKAIGSRYYFTGTECANGHLDKRNKHGRCMTCLKEANAKRDQSTGATIGRPVGSKTKVARKQGGRPAQQRRLEKRKTARIDTQIKKELKRIEIEAYYHEKKEKAIEAAKYVQPNLGGTKYYTDPANGRTAILYTYEDGFETHCVHRGIEHGYDLQRAAGKLDQHFDDGSSTARRLPEGRQCQYTREHGIDCIYCQKDNHPNNLSLIYEGTEKKFIPSLGRSI